MKIGIGLPNPIPGTKGSLLPAWAKRAEELGFSSLTTIDRVAYPTYESLTSLAAAAAVTERIGLLTNILLAPTRNGVLLAKQAASVDQLSAGRLTLGLAVGGREDDFELARQNFHDRGRRMDEYLSLMHNAWAGRPLANGTAPVGPEPVNGSIPILIGGTSDEAIERTVKWGVGWTAGGSGADQIAGFKERLETAWKDAGREGSPQIVALTYYSLGGDAAQASRAYLRDYYAYTGKRVDTIVEGPPRDEESVRAAVTRFDEAGVDMLIFDPTVADLAQVDRLAAVVL